MSRDELRVSWNIRKAQIHLTTKELYDAAKRYGLMILAFTLSCFSQSFPFVAIARKATFTWKTRRLVALNHPIAAKRMRIFADLAQNLVRRPYRIQPRTLSPSPLSMAQILIHRSLHHSGSKLTVFFLMGSYPKTILLTHTTSKLRSNEVRKLRLRRVIQRT